IHKKSGGKASGSVHVRTELRVLSPHGSSRAARLAKSLISKEPSIPVVVEKHSHYHAQPPDSLNKRRQAMAAPESSSSCSDALRPARRHSIRPSLGTTLLAGIATAAEPVQLPKVKVQAAEPSYRAPASPKLTSPLAGPPQTVAVIP